MINWQIQLRMLLSHDQTKSYNGCLFTLYFRRYRIVSKFRFATAVCNGVFPLEEKREYKYKMVARLLILSHAFTQLDYIGNLVPRPRGRKTRPGYEATYIGHIHMRAATIYCMSLCHDIKSSRHDMT